MSKKKKSKVPADVARRMALVGDDQATLQQKAKELHKARVRLDRLLKSVNGDTDKLSYNAKIAIGILSPFMNKEQTKVSERVTGYNKDVLINAIMRAEKFNAAATTVVKNEAAVEKEQRSSGLTKAELERRKRYWRIANYAGLLDFFAASDVNEDEDVYRIVTEAEEQNLSDEEFTRLVHEKINKKRGTGFDMWGNEFSNEYSNTWGENVLKTRQHEFTIGESGALEIAADVLASSAEWVI